MSATGTGGENPQLDTLNDIYIGRQPIYDRKMQVYGYELLFRGASDNRARFTDGDQATTDVIVNTFLEIGLDNIVGDHLAFINLTRAYFVGERTISLPRHRVVLELLEDIDADDEVIEGVKRLVEQDYTIALDDFIYHESLQPLVSLADMVKIDIMALDRAAVREHVRQLRRHPLRLLAEKVETQEDLDFCMELGFDYFQGYFFAQPKIIQGRRPPGNRLTVLKLLGSLQNPDLTPEQLENLIGRDPALNQSVLRHVNSTTLAVPHRIESIRQAVAVVGSRDVKAWAILAAMSQVDNKPTELVVTAMVRAKMAEGLATAMGAGQTDAFFTVGLFSALDALLDNSMEEILTQLPLAEPVAAALLHRRGLHGEILDCVLAYERGRWQDLDCKHLDRRKIRDCYLDAVRWAKDTGEQLFET
ncbi:MAG: HDOD domain-containing protein [Gammaproteobacteria bacterium]|jgi:EAL and modified HD-GYP domain-containing signal transduction protein